MSKYLDNDGLLYFWQKLKVLFGNKVDKVTGKGLSTNDFTDALKTKLDGIAAGAQVNSITGVKGDSESSYRTGNVNITAANVGAAASSHAHGNIQNGGTLQTTDVAIADGDKLVITDSSDSAKVARASIAFDGSTASMALTKKGTWETFNNYSLPTAGANTKGGVKIGSGLTMTGEVLSADVQSVDVMTGATSSADGASGLVPAPASANRDMFLKGNGTWDYPNDTHVKVKTVSSDTEMPIMSSDQGNTAISTYGANGVDSLAGVPSTLANRPTINASTGQLTAPSFSGSGANLTSLNGSNISSGTIAAARLPVASQSDQGAMSAADKIKLDAFSSASNYALKTDITSMYKHKGSVATTNDLPSTGNTEGDVYNVTATGMNYVWVVTSGTGAWDALGEVFTITSITNAEIDTILAA